MSSGSPAADAAQAITSNKAIASGSAASGVDFVRDIQPILKTSCYECHGPAKQKGKLRLDAKPLALKGGKSGPVIVPGNSEKSGLIERLTTGSDDDRMPQDKDALPAEQIALIRRWIDQGAPWPDSASAAGAKIEKHW